MRRAVSLPALCLLLLTLGLGGCSNSAQETQTPTPVKEQQQGKKKVITTFTILADMARNVAGDKLTVESITRLGAEIHGYEPTPSDLTKAMEADLLLYNGLNLERWFSKFYQNLGDVPAVILTEGVTPIAIASGPYSNKPNPHAWMSPKNALIYVENIRQALIKLDPANADTYNKNAAAYSAKIQALDTQLKKDLERLAPEQRYLVSCEGAFSYLTRDYGLQEVYMWPINAEQQSTPKQVKQVIEKVKNKGIKTVFCESTVNDKSQREVAKVTGAKFGGNLYVDSLSKDEGPVPTYLELLEYDVHLIRSGLLVLE